MPTTLDQVNYPDPLLGNQAVAAWLNTSLGKRMAAHVLTRSDGTEVDLNTLIGATNNYLAAGNAYSAALRPTYNATLPSPGDGTTVPPQVDARGSLRVTLMTRDGTTGPGTATLSVDGVTASVVGLVTGSAQYMVNQAGALDRRKGSASEGAVCKPYALTGNDWSYAAGAGGIVNTTTAVTIKAAAGAGIRNYITSLDLSWDALGAATEIAIRDGAGGTVLWRRRLSTAAQYGLPTIHFPQPLKSTANTLLEVVTLTASITGGVFINVQGHQA